jgi:hypothetical protein
MIARKAAASRTVQLLPFRNHPPGDNSQPVTTVVLESQMQPVGLLIAAERTNLTIKTRFEGMGSTYCHSALQQCLPLIRHQQYQSS